jgi:hypothetical protein
MSDSWKEVSSLIGKTVRWSQEPKSEEEGNKTVYVGAVVEGVYVERKDDIGQNASTIYLIETKEHGVLSVWDTFVLKDKMDAVSVGDEIRIECLGKQKPKGTGKPYYGFKVFSRPAPMKEVKGDDLPPM